MKLLPPREVEPVWPGGIGHQHLVPRAVQSVGVIQHHPDASGEVHERKHDRDAVRGHALSSSR